MRIGLVGIGAIGGKVARTVDRGAIPGVTLAAVAGRDLSRARAFAQSLEHPPRAAALAEWVAECDLVIEAAGAAAVDGIVRAALDNDRSVMVLSVGALLGRDDLFERARERGQTIHVPSGAIAGLDGIQAAMMGRVDSVTIVNRKPPAGLRGAPGVERVQVNLDELREPATLFDGTVREGYPLFPANVNVAAAVSLAGIGPDRTRMVVVADPSLQTNVHEVTVRGEIGTIRITVDGAPSAENPRTSASAAFSVLAYLRQMVSEHHLGI